MDFVSPAAQAQYAALVRESRDLLVCLDFDGVLAPIVDDPAQAHVHPDAVAGVLELADLVGAVAVVTGRPARQALDLGCLNELGTALEERGRRLHLRGQYGNERWDSGSGQVRSPRPPAGLASFAAELPQLLREHDAGAAHLEDKGLAIGVHTRRLPDPEGALERLREPVSALASRHGLLVEPGRQVLEARAPGSDKGDAVRDLVALTGARAVLVAGDDLGDVAAFEAVAGLRSERGLPGLLVASVSVPGQPVPELTARADLVVDGPDGVLEVLRRLTQDAAGARL